MPTFLYTNIYKSIDLVDNIWSGSLRSTFFNVLVCFDFLYSIIAGFKYKSIYQLKSLVDIVAYDLPGKIYRFGLVYIFLSHVYNFRIKLYTRIMEKAPQIPTISNLFSGALWLEREVWEFFGLYFLGHPDLRRLLTDYSVDDDSPKLRKDVSQVGFFNIRYTELESVFLFSYLLLNQKQKTIKHIL